MNNKPRPSLWKPRRNLSGGPDSGVSGGVASGESVCQVGVGPNHAKAQSGQAQSRQARSASAEPRRVRLLVSEEPPLPLPSIPPREVPPRPDGTLSFDLRVVEASTKQRNDPVSACWDDLSYIAGTT